jgi:succinate dehydrogenase / fumarate reductase cytochrome b subunit
VFHLANGIWTFGITWGIWITPAAQRWATVACLVFGLGLSVVGLSALGGFAWVVDVKQAREVEDKMLKARLDSGEITPEQIHHKAAESEQSETQAAAQP